MPASRIESRPEIAAPVREFAEHVSEGLSHPTQKWLSAQYLYDAVGSALFEAITALPEYGLTRADARLLQAHAPEIVAHSSGPLRVIELGSGSGNKTRWILEAAVAALGSVRYTPIDVSAAALEMCRNTLEAIPGVTIALENASYLPGLRRALSAREPNETVLVLFLGSTIGNFPPLDAAQFLMDVRGLLHTGDALLLGADLVKPVAQLIEAYDDPAGVTAAFNRNLLSRINRELGGNFQIRHFEHVARFDATESRVEMHLRSTRPQTVHIEASRRSFHFAAGETIWTESSHKFTPESIRELAAASGFHCSAQWLDGEWLFSESLLTAN
jgi:dimethylhistidine N-methyltransferase